MARLVLLLAILPMAGCGAAQRPDGGFGLLEVGMEAPSFRALDQDRRVRTVAELRGRPVVLFFYPRDGTPGCTAEACAFRDAWGRIEETGAVVVGVSSDDVISHARFAREHELTFWLLSDPDLSITRAYGVPTALGMASRVTYLLDSGGTVAAVFPDVDPAVHVAEILRASARAGSGRVRSGGRQEPARGDQPPQPVRPDSSTQ